MRTTRITWYGALLLLLVLLFTACAENKDDSDTVDNENGKGVDETAASSLKLLASSLQLPSADDESVTLDALVYDDGNALLEGVDVNFAIEDDYSGTLAVVNPTTNDAGRAQALLTTPNDKSNREIQVTASVGEVSDTVTVMVIGTEIAVISGSSTSTYDSVLELEVALRDSASTGIPGVSLAATSSAGNNIEEVAETSTDGQTTLTVHIANESNDIITISGAGASVSHSVQVTTDSFAFTAPVATGDEEWPEMNLGDVYDVTLEWTDAGVAQPGKNINFTSTRGTLTPTSATTDADGRATVSISADNAGLATITASSSSGITARLDALFVATVADSMFLQANPAIIGTNSLDSNDERSEIVATVRDPNNNLVKNQIIIFELDDVTGGTISPATAVTDLYGQARTTYTASPSPSAQDGITVTATVDGSDPVIQKSVQLTTTHQALFITLGTGNVLETPDTNTYALPYGVMVTDAAGWPSEDTDVTMNLWPTHYYKGYYVWGGKKWEQVITAGPCPNEDIDRSGILEDYEDYNDNGDLDPGNVGTVSPTTVNTGDDGYGQLDIVYFREHANWIDMELTARTMVSGSEDSERAYFNLPILAGDIGNEAVSPPGNPSPFGTSLTCDKDWYLYVSPEVLNSNGGVTLSLLESPSGNGIAGEPVTADIIYLTRVGDWTITATEGTTNAQGQFTSQVIITDAEPEDEAMIFFQVGGAIERAVMVSIP